MEELKKNIFIQVDYWSASSTGLTISWTRHTMYRRLISVTCYAESGTSFICVWSLRTSQGSWECMRVGIAKVSVCVCVCLCLSPSYLLLQAHQVTVQWTAQLVWMCMYTVIACGWQSVCFLTCVSEAWLCWSVSRMGDPVGLHSSGKGFGMAGREAGLTWCSSSWSLLQGAINTHISVTHSHRGRERERQTSFWNRTFHCSILQNMALSKGREKCVVRMQSA